MNRVYQEIMELKEAEELKNVIKRWHILSENIRTKPVNLPILLPDMLWVARSGVGKTRLLRLMSEYLYCQKNLMEFYGDVKFFEFYLNYCSPEEHFSELERLMEEVENAAGFRNEYKGVIYIDIGEWLEHYEEKHFVSFMEYLSANSDNWLVVLSVSSNSQNKIHNFNAFLSMYLRIEKITISFPKTEDLFDSIEERLKQYDLILEEDAKQLLFKTIEKLRKNRYFDGFKTIKMLCQDIIYDVFSNGTVDKLSLDANMISKFSSEGEYVNRMIANIERVNQIGFLDKR